jgi:hypothetical protein
MQLNLPIDSREDGSPADTRLDSNVISGKKDFTFDTLIVSGSLYELYHRVNRPVRLNHTPIAKRSKLKTQRSKEYKKRRTNRAFNNLRRLIHANFGVGSKFLTLTFSNDNDFDISSLTPCNKKLRYFIKKLRLQFPTLLYIGKPEYQKRGAVHYHLVTNMDYIEKDQLAEMWKHGFVDIRRINTDEELGPYITKYLSKDITDDRFKGHRAYFYSKNLNKPKKYYFDEVEQFKSYVSSNNLEPNFESSYKNDYSGITEFKEFHLTAPLNKDE